MQGHTPGPWRVKKSYTIEGYREFCIMRRSETLATSHNLGEDRDIEFEANAHLIAAAPDLLEALEVVAAMDNKDWGNVEWIMSMEAVVEQAKTAIAKARGQT